MKEKGTVIDLGKARAERSLRAASYLEQLEERRDELEKMITWCRESAFNLAMAGPWKEWGDAQPEGTSIEFVADELRACGDPIVAGIMELCGLAAALKEKIEESVV